MCEAVSAGGQGGHCGCGRNRGEAARLCSEFGMTAVVDARQEVPAPKSCRATLALGLGRGLASRRLRNCDGTPYPQDQGMFGAEQFRLMRPGAHFINIG